MSICRKLIYRIMGAVLALSILLLTVSGCESPSAADEKQKPNIPVEYTSFRDIPDVTEEEIRAIEEFQRQGRIFVYGANTSTEAFCSNDDTISGYSALFCEWLTDLFGIRFEPATYEWGDLIDGLESGEIDFTGELTATPERLEKYYMTGTIAERTVKYMRIAGSEPLSELAKVRPLNFLFLEDTTTYAAANPLIQDPFVAAFVDNYDSAYELLESGKADAFFDESTAEAAFDQYGDIVSTVFFPLIYSPVSLSTQNPENTPIISVVQKALENDTLRHLITLYNRGQHEYKIHKLHMQLSAGQRAYIRGKPEILIAAEYDNYPICFYNEREKQWQGIVMDILDEITSLTGITFKIVNNFDVEFQDLIRMLQDGEVQMISELIRSKDRVGNYIWPEAAIMKDYFALLSKSDYPSININEILYQRVGLIKNTAHMELFESWFPNHSSTYVYDNIDQAFLSLAKGETDVLMGSQGQLLMLTNYLEYVGYKMNLVFDRSYDSVFGFNKDETVLCAIVDKALRLIDTDGISGQWMRKTYDYREKLAQSRLPLLIGASVLLLCVLTLLFALFRRKQHEGKRMQKQIKSRTVQLDRQRDLMFVATSAAATLLETSAEEYFDAMYCGMEMIGESVDIDRVSIWQNFRFDDGRLYYKLVCQWANKGLPELDDSTYFAYDEMLPNWEHLFNRGESVNAVIDELDAEEREQMTKFGIKSILAVPVFLKKKLWGFVSFDDYRRNRRFPDVEQYVLRSWGLIAVGAIQRSDSAKGMRLALTKLKAVMSNYKGIIWSVDCDGVITTFNGQYLEKLNMQPSFLEGKNLEAARRKNRHLDIIDNVDKTFKFGQQDWISEVDGRIFHSYTTPMFDEEGNATGVVGSTDDVTDAIQLQRDLETAVEAAQTANRAKSAFLANMSHEIRTPMNAIIGMITIGKKAEDLNRKNYCFSKIEDASKHLLGVINDILDMSKIEANKFDLSPTEFSFEKMLQQVVNVVNFRVDEKQQILKVHIDSEIPRLLVGDNQRLAQVITNLLGNAVKFTPERGTISLDTRFLGEIDGDGDTAAGIAGADNTAAVKVCGDTGVSGGNLPPADDNTETGDGGVCTLEISVTDTGIGISPEQQAKLFKSFQQAESSTTRRFGGTGLGLSISKSIIEMMGGKIWIESELGSGAKFVFTVKVKRGSGKTAETSVKNTNWGDIRILVIDDDPDILSYFDGIIRGFGSTCDVAECAQDALNLISQNGGYDIYFVDWKMPFMDGIELTSIIKGSDGAQPINESDQLISGSAKPINGSAQPSRGSDQPINGSDQPLDGGGYTANSAGEGFISTGVGEGGASVGDGAAGTNGTTDVPHSRVTGATGTTGATDVPQGSAPVYENVSDQQGPQCGAYVVLMSAADWSSIEEDAKLAGVDKFLPKPLFPSAIADVINECLYSTQKQEEMAPDISGLFAGHHILLAEDVEINREIVLALLEPTQLKIDCAENGLEAVRMFSIAPDKYEVIFMDVQMPEMDGYEATQRIRALDAEKSKTVPIIAMTANVFKEDVERCIEAGMNSHVGKPLDFDEVLNKLIKYLS